MKNRYQRYEHNTRNIDHLPWGEKEGYRGLLKQLLGGVSIIVVCLVIFVLWS